MITAVVFTVIALVILARMAIVVPENSAYVVERLGRYFATLPPGLHMLLPFLDRVAFRYSLLPTEERITDNAITRDNIPVSITSRFRWSIADAQKAAYSSADVKQFVTELVRSRQRQSISERDWKDVRETTRELRSTVLNAVQEPAAQAGVTIAEVDVEEIARHQ